MSNINEVTENPNDKQAPGKPLDSDVIVPEDDGAPDDGQTAADDDGQGDIDETSAGGLEYPDGGSANLKKALAGDDPDADYVGSDDIKEPPAG